MKPNLNLKAYLMVYLATVILSASSCKKEDKEAPEPIGVSETEIPIPILKTYYSSLTNIDTAQLSYNEETTYFQWHGVNQVSRKELTFSYVINHKVN